MLLSDKKLRLCKLIIVACHASFNHLVVGAPADVDNDAYWALKKYQSGEPSMYIDHMRAGVLLAAHSSEAVLVFSGGKTEASAGSWTEAKTYLSIADHFRWWSHDEVKQRTATEDFARDSLENLLFSLFVHYQRTETYPSDVHVVSWQFKKERFELHRKTLGIPRERFQFTGVGNPHRLQEALESERKTLVLFEKDPWGRHEPLKLKRLSRTFGTDTHMYEACPGAAAILRYLDASDDSELLPLKFPWATYLNS